jgi:prepilin-type N-terminal cleavage/methylation domain-containing protein
MSLGSRRLPFYFLISNFDFPPYDFASMRSRRRDPLCLSGNPVSQFSTFSFLLSTSRASARSAFTLIELLVVMGIIALALAFLTPTLGPSSGRGLNAAAGQFKADLEGARLTAIAQRTKTRVIVAATNDPNWGQDTAWTAYIVAKLDTTSSPTKWIMQGKINRVPQSVTFDPLQPAPTPAMTPPPVYVLPTRQAAITAVAKAATASTTNFTGPYVEFRPTGGTSLDAAAGAEIVALQDAFVAPASTSPVRKNLKLRSQITIDPLSGSVSAQ